MNADSAHAIDDPSPWVVRFAHLVSAGATVLDVAAGHGRHAHYFAQRGARVLAIDRDAAALGSLRNVPGVSSLVADLEAGQWPLRGKTFDAVVVVNYLHRPAFAHLLDSLSPSGAFIYETFAQGNERFGRPRNPDFLLAPDELLERTQQRVRVVAFEQGEIASADRRAVVQRIAAVGLARPWPPALTSG